MDTELFKGTLTLLILSMLSHKPMYGYELATSVHRLSGGAFTFKEGSLYPSLHKLQADGLVTGEWEEGPSAGGPGRKRRYYHITAKGREVLTEKMASWRELCGAVNCVLENRDGQA